MSYRVNIFFAKFSACIFCVTCYAAQMSEEPAKREDVRTTVSLHPTVNQWAEELMDARGYNNFSAMIADLIRQECGKWKKWEKKP